MHNQIDDVIFFQIDGDRDVDEIFYDLSLLFDHTFYTGYSDGIASQPQGNGHMFDREI